MKLKRKLRFVAIQNIYVEHYIYVNLDVSYPVNETDDSLISVFRFKRDIIESTQSSYTSIKNIGIESGIHISMTLYIFIFYSKLNNSMLPQKWWKQPKTFINTLI